MFGKQLAERFPECRKQPERLPWTEDSCCTLVMQRLSPHSATHRAGCGVSVSLQLALSAANEAGQVLLCNL